MSKKSLKEIFDSFVDFLFPSNATCIGCGKELFVPNDRYALCPDCTRELHVIKTFCPRCGKPNEYGEVCNICLNTTTYFERNYACLIYDGLIKKLIIKFKFKDHAFLHKYLASFLMDKINSENIEFDLITAVPINKQRYRERGYNQTDLLAKELSKRTGVQYSNQIFKHENCGVQVGKNLAERVKNVEKTFFIKNNEVFKDKTVLVIDDIITTGSTLNSVAKTLKDAGAKKVIGLTICGVRLNDKSNDSNDFNDTISLNKLFTLD